MAVKTSSSCETSIKRDSCIRCALKHISQARVLLKEVKKGYPEFVWFAFGHLAEAEDELAQDHAEWANRVRDERQQKEYEPEYEIDFTALVRGLIAYEEELTEKILNDLQR